MDEAYRNRLMQRVQEVRQQLEASDASSATQDAELEARLQALEDVLDEREPLPALLRKVEQELVGWEVEHPRLTAVLQRITSALEGVGL